MSPGEWTTLHTVALASLLAWASGLRLYLVVFSLGVAGYYGYVDLPNGLEVLQHPWVIGAAGFMVVMEFLADKVPAIDSAWDAVHTVIRPIGGTLLAIQVLGHPSPAFTVIVGLLAGGTSLIAHTAKVEGFKGVPDGLLRVVGLRLK